MGIHNGNNALDEAPRLSKWEKDKMQTSDENYKEMTLIEETLRKNLEEIRRSGALDIREYENFLDNEGIEVEDGQVDQYR